MRLEQGYGSRAVLSSLLAHDCLWIVYVEAYHFIQVAHPADSGRKDMVYPTGYTIPTVPWDGIGMGPRGGGNTIPTKRYGMGF